MEKGGEETPEKEKEWEREREELTVCGRVGKKRTRKRKKMKKNKKEKKEMKHAGETEKERGGKRYIVGERKRKNVRCTRTETRKRPTN